MKRTFFVNKHSFFTDKMPQACRLNLGKLLTKIAFRAIIIIEKNLGGFSVMRKVKAIVVSVLATMTAILCLVGCGEPHDDGVCDHKECDTKITVVQYEKDVELCLAHAIEKYGEDFVNSFKNNE